MKDLTEMNRPGKNREPAHRTWGRSRSTRLKEFDYTSPFVVYHIIIGSFNQKTIFQCQGINKRIVETLKEASRMYGYRLLAYCLMPDHLHILAQAGENPKHLSNFVKGFKSYATRCVKKKLWQRGFYEHVLRKDEDLIVVGEYILDNPVRKEMVGNRSEYEWCGLLLDNDSRSVLTPVRTNNRNNLRQDE